MRADWKKESDMGVVLEVIVAMKVLKVKSGVLDDPTSPLSRYNRVSRAG